MAYITLADLNRYSTGLGAASPEQLEQGAANLENTAKGLRANAAGLQAVQPAAAQGLISQAVGMETQAASLRRQAGELRASNAAAAAASAANQKAALDLTASIVNAGAGVASTWMASDAARKQAAADRKAALAAAANQPFTNPMANYGQPAQSSGLSTGAMVGIGLGVLALVGGAVVLSRRQQ